MKAKIDKEGVLFLDKGYGFKEQMCIYPSYSCKDNCVAFREPEKRKTYESITDEAILNGEIKEKIVLELELCKQVGTLELEQLIDERVKG